MAPMASIHPERPTVLVVDDDPEQARALCAMLSAEGYDAEARATAALALTRAGQGVDLVLLDGRVAGAEEACASLKRMFQGDRVPVIWCAARGDAASRVQGLFAGADDAVGRPFEPREVLERVRAQLAVQGAHRAAAVARAALERAALVDRVTGARTFAATRDRLAADFARAEERHEPLACALLDVDHLKLVNDRDGRDAGDRVLFGVAQVVHKSLRDTDAVGRWGGDELLVLLPGAHFAGASRAATRIFRDAAARLREFPGRPSLTLSMGVALFPTREVRTAAQLVLAANDALAKAKREGGDQLCVLQQEGLWYTQRGATRAAAPSIPPPAPPEGSG